MSLLDIERGHESVQIAQLRARPECFRRRPAEAQPALNRLARFCRDWRIRRGRIGQPPRYDRAVPTGGPGPALAGTTRIVEDDIVRPARMLLPVAPPRERLRAQARAVSRPAGKMDHRRRVDTPRPGTKNDEPQPNRRLGQRFSGIKPSAGHGRSAGLLRLLRASVLFDIRRCHERGRRTEDQRYREQHPRDRAWSRAAHADSCARAIA